MSGDAECPQCARQSTAGKNCRYCDEFVPHVVTDWSHKQVRDGAVEAPAAAPSVMSPNIICRRLGCRTTGPFYGMVQSHCWRCGMRTAHAAPGCAAFKLPPNGASWFTRITERVTTLIDRMTA